MKEWKEGKGEAGVNKKDSPGSAADLGSDERGIWELRKKNTTTNHCISVHQ